MLSSCKPQIILRGPLLTPLTTDLFERWSHSLSSLLESHPFVSQAYYSLCGHSVNPPWSHLLFTCPKICPTIGQDSNPPPSLKSIAWLLTQIWFGNASLGFRDAKSFHPTLGPILMITFAALSNTLLLTSEVSQNHFLKPFDLSAHSSYLCLVKYCRKDQCRTCRHIIA